MLNFGDELTVETFKIPWLIWIQILILLLLMILLYCFSLFSLDLSPQNINNKNNSSLASASSNGSSSSSISEESGFDKKPVIKLNSTVTHRLQPSQIGEIQVIKGEIATGTGRRIIEENTERDSSNIYLHPCYYFRLARQAFLKCLGLDSVSENSSNRERKKDR